MIDLASFYRDTEDIDEVEAKLKRTIILEDLVNNSEVKQQSIFEIHNDNGLKKLLVTVDGDYKDAYYLGKKDKDTQGLMAYAMFNAIYADSPEILLDYQFIIAKETEVGIIGSLYSDTLREQMGTRHRDKYLIHPVLLGIKVQNSSAKLYAELNFTNIEQMQDFAQMLRCFAFAQPKEFFEAVQSKEWDTAQQFQERRWKKNTGCTEGHVMGRDYWVADYALQRKRDNDSSGPAGDITGSDSVREDTTE